MSKGFKLNPRFQQQWREAISELAAIGKKSDPESVQKLVTLSARRFVKNVADITPPARGTADSSAKRAGENAIVSDLLKIALPVGGVSRSAARDTLASAEELLAAHARAIGKADGRVNPRSRKEKLLVLQSDFRRVLTDLQKRVGWLAAGLNAAATRLGASLPAWIKRHGAKYGVIEVQESAHGIRIRIGQNVPYADNARGYARQWNFALQKEITALLNQVKAIHASNGKRARAKLK